MTVIRATALSLALLGNAVANAQPAEPDGYRTENYRAPTPQTVAGGVTLDTVSAHELDRKSVV